MPNFQKILEQFTVSINENGETLVDKYVTDENGQFTTKEYVCDTDWTIREITPSESSSGKKIDENGEALEGAVIFFDKSFSLQKFLWQIHKVGSPRDLFLMKNFMRWNTILLVNDVTEGGAG